MSFGELLVLVLAFGGTLASILGAFYMVASRRNGRETRAVIQQTIQQIQELIRTLREDTGALLERMDQRADERHREVIEAIRALRSV